ncbi:hypothetical protein BCR37DRAFT_381674 [Protomyces lactucae-debilis]|uniref:C3H1-type domain-containing protein n=1 Tax=Protomyces lactucae-debilis TaxID=2754530 RepID=A0A1Y2F6F7_PROLT|nr:uncharacterized protein BCR37DRAFT_381674 [Protomyces lactucae-debilis]ORY79490.1 hypothetical protein BCR37DRAFT_381674 [Protomyces lactucae-debilis]
MTAATRRQAHHHHSHAQPKASHASHLEQQASTALGRQEDPLLARSPPAAKNLQHVPCKFYRSGQCTAGRNCVFSHIVEQEQERAPCKYFQKGNCRFGNKCALAHILPDGRRVNHNTPASNAHRQQQQQQQHGLAIGPRIVPEHRGRHQAASGIHAELLQSQSQQSQSHHGMSEQSTQRSLNALDVQFGDIHLASSDGEEWPSSTTRHEQPGTQLRPLGPLDAQLPASLDSNGISYFARHGPVAASVPHSTGFGMPDRPSHPSSPLHQAFAIQPSTSLFAPTLGTPPRATIGSLTLGRAMFERRASAFDTQPSGSQDPWSNLGTARSKTSARATPHEDRSEDPFLFEEDFVPSSLTELLTPAERHRRLSSSKLPPATMRDEMAPSAQASKSPTGSLSGSPSSSRFGALFLKHKEKETLSPGLSPVSLGQLPVSASYAGSSSSPRINHALMTVGSPLARDVRSAATSPSNFLVSPVRPSLAVHGSSLRSAGGMTDLRGEAKEFKTAVAAAAAVQSDEEPFEMDI